MLRLSPLMEIVEDKIPSQTKKAGMPFRQSGRLHHAQPCSIGNWRHKDPRLSVPTSRWVWLFLDYNLYFTTLSKKQGVFSMRESGHTRLAGSYL